MKDNLFSSIAFRRLFTSLLLGVVVGLFTYSMGYLPYDDLIQGVWVFLTTTVSAFFAFRKQIAKFEEREDRYKRVATEMLQIRLEEEPHLISTLLSGRDAPEMWAIWVNELFDFNFFKCRGLHAIDALFHSDDLPGEGIARATKWIGDALKGHEHKTQEEKEEVISKALEKLVDDSQSLLGEQFSPGYYFCKIEKGPLPYGIFMESKEKGAKVFATTYRKKIVDQGKVKEIQAVRLGLNLKKMTEENWEKLVHAIDSLLPWLDRKNLGDGPRSWTSQLFIQEKQDVDVNEFRKRLNQLPEIIKQYETLEP